MNDSVQLILAFIGGIACGLSLSALLCLVYSRFRYVLFIISILFMGMMIYAVQREGLLGMISNIFWMSAFLKGIILGFAMEAIYGRSLREKNKKGIKRMDTARENLNFVGADTAKNLIALSTNKQSIRSVEEKKISPTVIPSNTKENHLDLLIQDKAKSEK